MNMFEICRLNQKQFRLLYSVEQKEFIDDMPELLGHEWNGSLSYPPWHWGDGQLIHELKGYIRDSLEESQGLFCAYCGGELDLTSVAQIEHIAPKGPERYPQFMFHSSNLTLACSLCNGFEKKEREEYYNTIDNLEENYEDCQFNIVHPYLHYPNEHFDLGREGNGITISSKSSQGIRSIEVFNLDDEHHTNDRGKRLREYLLTIDPEYNEAYERCCKRMGI